MVVNDQGLVEAKIVTTAEVIDNQWRITAGLEAGDKLIVEGLQRSVQVHQSPPKLFLKPKQNRA